MNLEKLYDRYGEKLYHYLVLKLGSCQDAEDILQEVFYRFGRYSVRWKMVRNPKAFVFKAARNEANRFIKKRIVQQKTMNSSCTASVPTKKTTAGERHSKSRSLSWKRKMTGPGENE